MSARRMLPNRVNASKSTGPKLKVGKEAASRNAIRHGLRSQNFLLDGEDPNEIPQLQSNLFDASRPVGAIEFALAERIVSLALNRKTSPDFVGYWQRHRPH